MLRAVVSLVAVFVASVLIGCSSESNAQHSHGPIEVVGGAKHSFGSVEVTGDNLVHTFVLRNHLADDVTVTDARKTCGCLSVTVEPMTLPAGGEARVNVELEARLFTGQKGTHVVLHFDRKDIEPLILQVDAFLVSDYRVHVDPLVWAVDGGGEGGQPKRKFHVTEFLSKSLGETPEASIGETRVESLSEAIRVVSTDAWRSGGWRAYGFARESEIVLELDVEKANASTDRQWLLRFEHEPKEGKTQVATVGLSVRIY